MAEKKNLLILKEIRIGGKPQPVGSVIAKGDFPNKGDWQNLCNMTPARCIETDAPVAGAPVADAPVAGAEKPKLPK